MAASVHDDTAIADDDTIHERVIDEPEAVGIALLEVGQHSLDQGGAVDAALAVREHSAVSVVIRVQELANAGLGDDRVEGGELGRDLLEELGLVGDHAGLQAQAALPAEQVVAQVHLEVVEREHAHVAGEPLDADGGAGLGGHEVEQLVGGVERPLGIDRLLRPERIGDVVERAFEVGGQLARIVAVAPRATRSRSMSITRCGVDRRVKKAVATPAMPAPTITTSVARIRLQRPRRPIGCQLGDPWRPTGQVSVALDGGPATIRSSHVRHVPLTWETQGPVGSGFGHAGLRTVSPGDGS